MKITVIGDIHGLTVWQDIVAEENDSDLFVFLGDYLDSFTVKPKDQIDNFEKILSFADSDRVNLLFGNHDYHYLKTAIVRGIYYSGFVPSIAWKASNLIEEGMKEGLFNLTMKHKDIVLSHAGFSKTWLKNTIGKEEYDFTALNNLFYEQPYRLGFVDNSKYPDPTGNDVFQGPLWIRPPALSKDSIDFRQIVGHTEVTRETIGNIYLNDKLPQNKYIVINNENIEYRTYNP